MLYYFATSLNIVHLNFSTQTDPYGCQSYCSHGRLNNGKLTRFILMDFPIPIYIISMD